MKLRELRNKRKVSFWAKVLPYLPYAFQSGVLVLSLLLIIAFSAWYTAFLQNLPPGLPILWMMLVILGPLTVYSGFRTYVQPADVVFLLPQENRMKEYLAPTYRSGVIYKLIGLYVVLLVLWPLYIRNGGQTHPLWLILIVLCLLKMLSAYGAWQELRITTNRARMGYRLLRWSFIILMLAAWLWQPAWKSMLFMVLVSVNYILALRFPMKHVVPWDNLIANEKAGAAKVMLILGWFVEVPAEGQKVIRRRWLSAVGNHITWTRKTSYRYLLAKTFVRSELLGILIRLGLLGMVVVGWNGSTWLGAGIYLFFIFLTGTQLTSLRYVHSDSPAASYYPISSGVRMQEIVRLASNVLLGLSLLLWIPMAVAEGRNWPILLGSLVLGILLALGMRSSWIKKWRDDEDE
ncbi:ABC-2 type transport system permease protein [Fontibacillus panacisegetis]|uniref:ABC-2 type transport system permease protein n=1 Tax=Fontibacillus panacisegetis TaxID=670482 RepID=A0A1G7II32_9BACL|nr:ABC transporter permease [Fontibacillus panacisegetis]SDF11939.1 ABC-2 type transport system permease protein [Fontibacillus panacisegetis]